MKYFEQMERAARTASVHLSATMPGLPTVPMWFGVGQKFKVKSSIMHYELLTDI